MIVSGKAAKDAKKIFFNINRLTLRSLRLCVKKSFCGFIKCKKIKISRNMRYLLCIIFSVLLLTGITGGPALANERLIVAVAANFIRPMAEISALFFQQTGIRIESAYGATGKLYAQIQRGAPFDVFLAADRKRPQLLHEQGLASLPETYAQGRVVLWSSGQGLDRISSWQELLNDPAVRRIAIPSPATAPYGAAAADALKTAALWDRLQEKLVYGQSVAQAFQFGASRGVDAAFVSASYALSKQGRQGRSFPIAEAGLIVQQACIMNNSSKKRLAKEFVTFLTADRMGPLLARYGYE